MSKTSRQPVRLKPDTTKRLRSYEAIARALVARIDLIPSYPDIYDLDEERALVAAFIEQHLNDDSNVEMQSYEADQDRDTETIAAALPDDLRTVFFTLLSHRDTMLWIKGEIIYTLGIEVGRRLAGDAR